MLGLELSLESASMKRGGGAFNPLSLSPSALFDATIEPAGAIDQLDDLSGNAKHVLQGSAGNQPTATGTYASFDGDDQLVGQAVSNYLTASTFDLVISGRFDSSATDSANFHENKGIIGEDAGYFGISCRSSGKIVAGVWDGGVKNVEDIYTIGQDFTAHVRLSGGTLSLTINARTPVTLASGNIQVVTGLLRLGSHFGGSFTGRVRKVFFRKTVLSAGELASVKSWAGA